MKTIISHFIKYPIAGWVIVLAFLFLGVAGMLQLKSSFFPLVESRVINISVVYPGASPQEMEEGIVLKIEDNIRGLVGIDRFTSVSMENSATITIEALKGYDIDVVLADIKNAVDKIPSFPSGMEPPVISKTTFRTEAVTLVVSSRHLNLTDLKAIAREVENDLRNIEGISQIDISGFPDEEIEIALNENKLRSYGLTFQEVADAVSNSNILVTGGSIKTSAEEYLIRVRNRSYHGEELENNIVRMDQNGGVVYLKDIATVRDRWSENPNRIYFNGQPAIRLQVDATISEDLISVANATMGYMEAFNASQDNVQLDITQNSSTTIIQRTILLLKNGTQGIFLVLFFLAIFLKPRLAFWVAFGLPIAFLGMFIFAGSLGVTINVLSLFGMIIVIGILVDDGIVISENIYHHHEKGKPAIQAAIDGTMEVMPAIVSAILTTVVAFSSFFFLEGRIGEFFGEAATIVILTLTVSLVEALIMLPSHIAHSKALSQNQKTYWFNRVADDWINWFKDKIYGPALRFFLDHKLLGFAIPISMFILTRACMQAGIIRSDFFPKIASDRITVTLKMPQGTNEHITDSIIGMIENKTWEINEEFTSKQSGQKQVIENVVRQIGPGTANASLRINLLPGEERDFSSNLISNRIMEHVGIIDGVESIEFGAGSNFGGMPVSMALLSENSEQLHGAKDLIKNYLQQNPALKDIQDNNPAGIKEIEIKLKPHAYALGYDLAQVMAQVRSGFFGFQAQRYQRGRDEIKIWVRYDEETRSSVKNLDDMRIVSTTGERVPFSEIASYQISRGDIAINHLNGKREIRIEANLKDTQGSGSEVMAALKEDMLPTLESQYPKVTPVFEGQNREAQKTTGSAGKVLPIIIFLIYIIIAFTFRSLSQPLLLLLMVPFSLIGVAWGHWIHNFSINVLSFLGIIALIGIVVNDGLVLIGKFNSYLKEGINYYEALIEAGKSRFRAIFLTSITTVAGLAPLIFETSRQAQFLIPMAISIAYGIMLATILTLIMLPLMLSLGNSIKVSAIWVWTGQKPTRESVERAIKELQNEKKHD